MIQDHFLSSHCFVACLPRSSLLSCHIVNERPQTSYKFNPKSSLVTTASCPCESSRERRGVLIRSRDNEGCELGSFPTHRLCQGCQVGSCRQAMRSLQTSQLVGLSDCSACHLPTSKHRSLLYHVKNCFSRPSQPVHELNQGNVE